MNLTAAGPGASAYAVNNVSSSNNNQSPSSTTNNKRKSTLDLDEENVQPSASSEASTSLVNGVSMSGVEGEFVPPIRSVAGLSLHSVQPLQHHPRGELPAHQQSQQAGQYRPIRQQTYHSATAESYAIQPPTLLAQTDFGWPVSGSSGVRGEDSHARGAAHLPEEDQDFVPISTSVLPQLYSTGLVDEHITHHHQHPQQAAAHHHLLATTSSHHGHGPTHPHHGHPQHQYSRSAATDMSSPHPYGHTTQPQYWSDYSTFSQLGPTEPGGYASLGVGVGGIGAMGLALQGGQHPQQQQQQQPHLLSHPQHANVSNVPGMYIPDSYELYGELGFHSLNLERSLTDCASMFSR